MAYRWTDFVFQYCGERIAVRITHDRSTLQTLITVATDDKFEIDETNNRVHILQEKPIVIEVPAG